MRTFALLTAFVALLLTTIAADAKTFSKSESDVTQVMIVTGPATSVTKTTAWGIDSTYIGPGDINRLVSIDIYLDNEGKIGFVRIVRLTTVGDQVTQLFADVRELSIQTLAAGTNRPHKRIPISVRSMDELKFP
ncbi:MAG: hypothetical protein HQK87_03020 [Nitrospinae bacterium]|nr:hypothetical protein [Nitrospinota bacterium]